MPTTSGVCPVHGAVEFRMHRKGFDPTGKQRYVTRCPACHADAEYIRRTGLAETAHRTLVATDGSHNGDEAGFAYVVDAYTYGFGPLGPGVDTELVAVRRALRAIPGPLLVALDHRDTYRYVGLGEEPGRRNFYRNAYLSTRALLAERDVLFVLRDRDTGPPEHALAHYLAFLGRRGRVPVPGEPAPGAERILMAAEPYEVAALMVREVLFPLHP